MDIRNKKKEFVQK